MRAPLCTCSCSLLHHRLWLPSPSPSHTYHHAVTWNHQRTASATAVSPLSYHQHRWQSSPARAQRSAGRWRGKDGGMHADTAAQPLAMPQHLLSSITYLASYSTHLQHAIQQPVSVRWASSNPSVLTYSSHVGVKDDELRQGLHDIMKLPLDQWPKDAGSIHLLFYISLYLHEWSFFHRLFYILPSKFLASHPLHVSFYLAVSYQALMARGKDNAQYIQTHAPKLMTYMTQLMSHAHINVYPIALELTSTVSPATLLSLFNTYLSKLKIIATSPPSASPTEPIRPMHITDYEHVLTVVLDDSGPDVAGEWVRNHSSLFDHHSSPLGFALLPTHRTYLLWLQCNFPSDAHYQPHFFFTAMKDLSSAQSKPDYHFPQPPPPFFTLPTDKFEWSEQLQSRLLKLMPEIWQQLRQIVPPRKQIFSSEWFYDRLDQLLSTSSPLSVLQHWHSFVGRTDTTKVVFPTQAVIERVVAYLASHGMSEECNRIIRQMSGRTGVYHAITQLKGAHHIHPPASVHITPTLAAHHLSAILTNCLFHQLPRYPLSEYRFLLSRCADVFDGVATKYRQRLLRQGGAVLPEQVTHHHMLILAFTGRFEQVKEEYDGLKKKSVDARFYYAMALSLSPDEHALGRKHLAQLIYMLPSSPTHQQQPHQARHYVLYAIKIWSALQRERNIVDFLLALIPEIKLKTLGCSATARAFYEPLLQPDFFVEVLKCLQQIDAPNLSSLYRSHHTESAPLTIYQLFIKDSGYSPTGHMYVELMIALLKRQCYRDALGYIELLLGKDMSLTQEQLNRLFSSMRNAQVGPLEAAVEGFHNTVLRWQRMEADAADAPTERKPHSGGDDSHSQSDMDDGDDSSDVDFTPPARHTFLQQVASKDPLFASLLADIVYDTHTRNPSQPDGDAELSWQQPADQQTGQAEAGSTHQELYQPTQSIPPSYSHTAQSVHVSAASSPPSFDHPLSYVQSVSLVHQLKGELEATIRRVEREREGEAEEERMGGTHDLGLSYRYNTPTPTPTPSSTHAH